MIASLRGTLLDRREGTCVVEAGGVGYLVSLSTPTAAGLPPVGEDVFLWTRQVVREDALLLFGFLEREELRLFDLLITVSGVGPRVALAVLSGLRPEALVRAIRTEQVGALVAVPGIGRKTAERLVVELRDRLDASPLPAREGGVLPRGERFDDAIAALARLGYTATQAQDAVRRASETRDDLSLEELVRRSLALLAKRPMAAR